MFILYIWKFGLTRNDLYSYLFFFSNQCNTTVTVVSAMIEIVSNTDKPKNTTLYHHLANVCAKLRRELNNQSSYTTDLGSGPLPRFQVSNSILYTEKELIVTIDFLENTFSEFSKKLYNIKERLLICVLAYIQ